MSKSFEKIVRDPCVCSNQPRITEAKLTVLDIVSGIDIEGFEEFIAHHELYAEQIYQAINYCAVLECQKSEGDYCHGCILNTIKHGWEFNIEELQEFSIGNKKYVRHLKTNSIYIGTLEEYREQSFGQMGWRIAELIKEKYNM